MTMIEVGSAAAERLAGASVGWLTTVAVSGQPQTSYVWFHFDGNNLLIFSQPDAPKIRNVAHNAKVSFHLDGDGFGGNVLTMDAEAHLVADVDPSRTEIYLAKYDDPIRNVLKTTPEEMLSRFSASLIVTPTRVRVW
jgi:PPOX class probable F420-dependent enzyme